MKTRICILTVSAVAAISAPLAGAAIPADSQSGSGNTSRHPLVIKPTVKKGKSTMGQVTGQAYNPHAYVPGGSSPSVAQAIVSLGQRALR